MNMAAGIVERVRLSITDKLTSAGATSKANAVTPDEADLTLSERGWLVYAASGMTSKIRKTPDHRYHLERI